VTTTTTWVALLRGINVGRAKRVAMPDLRALLERLGYGNVATHLQSGNALFTTTKGSASSIAARIEKQMTADLGVQSTIIMRTASELSGAVDANPFVEAKIDPKQLHAVFLSAAPSSAKLKALDPDEYAPDEFAVGDGVVYLRLPNGVAGSKIPALDKPLGMAATMRTWRTTTRLSELAAEIDAAT
jgi:uncharacterized protein (DUF1697 family)